MIVKLIIIHINPTTLTPQTLSLLTPLDFLLISSISPKFLTISLQNSKTMKYLQHDDSLTLSLGFPPPSTTTTSNHPFPKREEEPSLSLSLSGEKREVVAEEAPCSGSSSLSNMSVSVKRERPESDVSDDDVDVYRGGGAEVEEDHGNTNNRRKKLRLTKDQSALLEDSFNQQSTLNPKQKQGLAERLKLRPRQVEVWFQNRRARSKLKQTEVELECLKKWRETLTEENKRLEKEAEKLKGIKQGQPIYMQLPPTTTLTLCPSCQTTTTTTNNNNNNNNRPFSSSGVKNSHLYVAAPTTPLFVDN